MSIRTAFRASGRILNQAGQAFVRELAGGVSGTEIWGGDIRAERETLIDQVKWDDTERIDRIDEMVSMDSTIESVMNAIELPIKSAPASIEPASEDNADMRIAEAVEQDWLNNPNFTWKEKLSEILLFLRYGYCIMWKEYERVEGRTRLKTWAYRRPDTIDQWDISNDGMLLRVRQITTAPDGTNVDVWLPEKKPTSSMDHPLFHIAYKQIGDNFKGVPILRQAWRPYVVKREMMQNFALQSTFASLGIPHAKWKGTIPAEGTADRTAVQNAMKYLQVGARNYLESGGDIVDMELWGGKDRVGYDLVPGMVYCDMQICEAMLAGFLQQSKQSIGARAMQDSNIGLFLDNLEGISNQCEDVLNEGRRGMQNIKQYIDHNFPESQSRDFKYPKLRIAQVNTMDLEKWAGIINMFVSAGMPIYPQDWEIIRDRGGLADIEIEELQGAADAQRQREETALSKLRRYSRN